MRRLIFACFALLSLNLLPASAQTTAPAPQATTQPDKAIAGPTPLQPSNPESKLVETWLNMSGHFNDRLLATIYWSLGSIGGLLVILTGYSWFVNFRVYERDKRSMMTELREEQGLSFRNLENSFKQAVERDLHKSFAKIEADIKAENTKFHDEIKKTISSLSSKINSNRQAIFGIHVENEIKEAEEWINQKVYENAISCYTRTIENALHSPDFEWRIGDALKGMGDLLEKGHVRRGDWEPEFMQVVPKIPATYQSLKERVLNLLAKT